MRAILWAALIMLGCAASSANAKSGDKSLYERLGKKEAITAVVDDFVANLAADTRINSFFAKTDVPKLKRLLVEQICQATGGPCTYTGRDMRTAHKGFDIGRDQFNALVEDLQKSMDERGIPFRAQNKLLARLAPLHRDIEHR